jgi:hypothetical protein
LQSKLPQKSHTVYLGEALKQGVSVLVGNPLAQKLRICSQLVDALIHLRDLKLLFLDLHEGYLSVQDNLLEVQIDCFYKHSMKEDSPEWTRIRAPELINDKLIVGDHASHDYSSADVLEPRQPSYWNPMGPFGKTGLLNNRFDSQVLRFKRVGITNYCRYSPSRTEDSKQYTTYSTVGEVFSFQPKTETKLGSHTTMPRRCYTNPSGSLPNL